MVDPDLRRYNPLSKTASTPASPDCGVPSSFVLLREMCQLLAAT
jgi:hypothetical protein